MSTNVVVRFASPRRSESRRGAALPVVILLMVILALSLTAAFTLNSNEMRSVDNQQEQIEAFALAESGRERYLQDRGSFGFVGEPAASESIRVVQAGGYADVVVTRLRVSAGGVPGLYALRSTGVRTNARMADVPAATRTVGQIFKWETGMMNVPGAWTSLSGINKNGGSGEMSGADECGMLPAVAGVAVPTTPGYTQSGGTSIPTGNPPIKDLGPQPGSNDSARVDWAGVLSGSSLVPTITVPPSTFPSSSAFADTSYWPIIKVIGDLSLPSSGRGVLIVSGNFTITGGQAWEGVLLVGGTVTSNGGNTIRGAVISGLNQQLGMAVGVSDIANGTKIFRYNSCLVRRALRPMSGLVPMDNAWADNWASY
jgi:Tfp pilus assembly protein PilX